jgi:hypothetical protein
VGKGTTVQRLEITQRREISRARNFALGPEIPPQGRNFCPWTKFLGAGNSKFHEFLALRNSANSFTKHCGATLCKGAGNSGLAEFPGARNSIIFGPRKFG